MDIEQYSMIIEQLDGNISESKFRKDFKLTESNEKYWYFRPIFKTIEYMHIKKYALIDITLDNIAFKGSDFKNEIIYKFIDFGSVKPFNKLVQL